MIVCDAAQKLARIESASPQQSSVRLMPGDIHRIYGRVGAVGIISGERYYWLVKRGVVSMMPAAVIEGAQA